MVEMLLAFPASEATIAAVKAAMDSPLNPFGRKPRMAYSIVLASSEELGQVTFLYSTRLRSREHDDDGISSFRKPANKIPLRAVGRLAPRARWVMYWLHPK